MPDNKTPESMLGLSLSNGRFGNHVTYTMLFAAIQHKKAVIRERRVSEAHCEMTMTIDIVCQQVIDQYATGIPISETTVT